MISSNVEKIIDRIDSLTGLAISPGDTGRQFAAVSERLQATYNLVKLVYGQRSQQEATITGAVEHARKSPINIHLTFVTQVWPVVLGTLSAMRDDVEEGLVGDLMRRAAGVALADMLPLAKEALSAGRDGATNVAAVLTAAAYEDTIRKMGESLAGVTDRPDLKNVVDALKKANVPTGAPLTTALSYLKFRNDALHADWAKITPALVSSCMAFTEGLILQHLA